MLVDELDLSDEVCQALREQGFVELYPPQAEAIPMALTGKNVVASMPTASGKSLIAYCAALKNIVEQRKRVLYIVPLKSLATEKRDDFERFSYLGFKVGLSIGDLDSDGQRLNEYDIIVATSEKADSLMRHGNSWISDVGLTICDEVHLLHDPSRGPTLEVAITKLRRRNGGMQVIALSATISNSLDLAQWLDAELFRTEWRPIELLQGIYLNQEIEFTDGTRRKIKNSKDDVLALILDIVQEGGQCIVFVNTRRSTESLAFNYSGHLATVSDVCLTDDEERLLEGDADITAIGRKLASCVRCGIAFHNAGLEFRQRQFIESQFKAGRIKCIVATPTLAAGINLPARRVIVRDTTRFESGAGNAPISVMEIKQMCGRAGRPGFDPYGEAILMAKNEKNAKHLLEDYLLCESENVMSKLGNERTLRTHILGLIASEDVSSIDDIIGFIGDAFYGSQSSLYGVEGVVENVVESLAEVEMISYEDDVIVPLQFGKRISDLYIDPESAIVLKKLVLSVEEDTDIFVILHTIATTPDVMGLYPRKSDRDMLMDLVEHHQGEFIAEVPESTDYQFEYFMGAVKVAYMCQEWIDETEEDIITATLGIGPGDIRGRVESMEWLMYATVEIAAIFRPQAVKRLRPLLSRIKYGVREELVDLVSLRGVGRAKARILYDHGIREKGDILTADVTRIASLPKIGPSLARSLKEQVGDVHAPSADRVTAWSDTESHLMTVPEETDAGAKGPKQSSLLDF